MVKQEPSKQPVTPRSFRISSPTSATKGPLIFGACAMVAVIVLGAAALRAYSKATGLADHIVEVRERCDQWLRGVLDAETGVRGYVASGADVFLEPYVLASGHAPKQASF